MNYYLLMSADRWAPTWTELLTVLQDKAFHNDWVITLVNTGARKSVRVERTSNRDVHCFVTCYQDYNPNPVIGFYVGHGDGDSATFARKIALALRAARGIADIRHFLPFDNDQQVVTSPF